MIRSRRSSMSALAVLLALAACAGSAAAQLAPAPTPAPSADMHPRGSGARAPADAPTPRPDAGRTFTFQLVLLVAETGGPSRFENVPANAQKALEDVKGFLPYTSYKLLDLAWLRSSRTAEAQVSGPDGRVLSAGIRFYSDPEDSDRIEIQRLTIVDAPRIPLMLEAPRSDGTPTALVQPTARPLLETSFGMKAGETVVVGTAKLDGPSKALVVLLSALP